MPTLAESVLPGFDVTPWFGIVAPAGTPARIIDRLNEAIVKALRQPDAQESLASQGAKVVTSTPEEFGAFLNREIPQWAQVVKSSGARVD